MNTSENELILQDVVDIIDELEERGQYSWVDIKTQEGCRFRITVAQNMLSLKNLYEDNEDKPHCQGVESVVADRAKVVYLLPQYVSVIGKSRDESKSKFVKQKYSTRRNRK